VIEEAWEQFLQVDEKGGYLAALKAGTIQEEIEETANKRMINSLPAAKYCWAPISFQTSMKKSKTQLMPIF
jgi:hypothetical protein